MTRILLAVALAAALCLGACAPRVDTTASVAPHVELTLGAAAAPVAPPPPTIVKREVLVTPQVPRSWRQCEPAPPLLADNATQDDETLAYLRERHAGADCRQKLGTVDDLLAKAEADARRCGK